MAYVNFQRSYIRFKLVYYGPGLCGKTTNLEKLHELSEGQVEMVSLETEGDRTIFFDYMPINLGKMGGIETVLKLYTVPGQVRYNRTRRMVLRDVDGVVFVADSQKAALTDNLESLKNLEENLAEEGMDLSSIPMIIQYNKRDLPEVLEIEELERELNPRGLKWFPASAVNGENVKETLTALAREVYTIAMERYGLRDSDQPPIQPIADSASQEKPPAEAEPAEDSPEGEGPRETAVPGEIKDQPETGEETGDTWSVAPPPGSQPPGPVSEPPQDQRVSRKMDTLAPDAVRERWKDSVVPAPELAGVMASMEKRVFTQYVEMREILQQIVMAQVEQDSIDEFRDNIVEAQKQLGAILEQSTINLMAVKETLGSLVTRNDDLQRTVDGMSKTVSGLQEDIKKDIRHEVDKYLSDFLANMEAGGAETEPALEEIDDE